MRKRRRMGFTLAELLIVIAILGVLIAVAIPVFTSSLEKVRETTCQANRRSLLAVVTYDTLLEGSLKGAISVGDTSARWNDLKEQYTQLNFADKLCPSDGVITIKRPVKDGGFVITCSVHDGAVDKPALPDTLLKDDGMCKAWETSQDNDLLSITNPPKGGGDHDYRDLFKEKSGGTFPKADYEQVLSKFPSNLPSKSIYNTSQDALVWVGVRKFFKENKSADFLMATTASRAADQYSGVLLYYNGKYYYSNKMTNQKIDYARLYGTNAYNLADVEKYLTEQGWAPCP